MDDDRVGMFLVPESVARVAATTREQMDVESGRESERRRSQRERGRARLATNAGVR